MGNVGELPPDRLCLAHLMRGFAKRSTLDVGFLTLLEPYAVALSPQGLETSSILHMPESVLNHTTLHTDTGRPSP